MQVDGNGNPIKPTQPYNPDPNFSSDSPDGSTAGGQSFTFPTTVKLPPSPGKLSNSGSLGNWYFDQYTLKYKVTLFHNGIAFELTPYTMQIKTHNALGESSGQFSLLLSFQKRWDLFIQPNDYIEIGFTRYLDYIPIIMRGFVSNVRRNRIVDDSGRLHRGIMVNGENFGKIWNNYQVEYLVAEPGMAGQGIDVDPALGLMAPKLTENFGIGTIDQGASMTPEELMQGITDNMLNAQLKALQQVNPAIPLITCNSNVLPDYQYNMLQIQQFTGTAYNLAEQYANAPWCELFIDEGAAGPTIFHRNAPFKLQDGPLAFSESLPDSVNFPHQYISDRDVIEEDIGASDAEAYSYYFTYPNTFLIDQESFKAMAVGTQNLTPASESNGTNISNPHVDLLNLYRYGFKELIIGSYAIPTTDLNAGLALSIKMNKWLADVFGWAPVMLNGTMRIKGNEHMRIGRYVTQKSTGEEYYIESVDHDLTVYQTDSLGGDNVYSFQTTIGVTRGRRLV